MLEATAWIDITAGALIAIYALVRLGTGRRAASATEPSSWRVLLFGLLLATIGASQLAAGASNDLLQGAGVAAASVIIVWMVVGWTKELKRRKPHKR